MYLLKNQTRNSHSSNSQLTPVSMLNSRLAITKNFETHIFAFASLATRTQQTCNSQMYLLKTQTRNSLSANSQLAPVSLLNSRLAITTRDSQLQKRTRIFAFASCEWTNSRLARTNSILATRRKLDSWFGGLSNKNLAEAVSNR